MIPTILRLGKLMGNDIKFEKERLWNYVTAFRACGKHPFIEALNIVENEMVVNKTSLILESCSSIALLKQRINAFIL